MQYRSSQPTHSSSLHRTGSILHLTTRLYKDYVRKYLSLLYILVALLIVLAATTSVQPILLQQAFDKIFGDKDVRYLVLLPIVIIVISAIQAIATYSSALLMNRFGSSLTADMRSALFSHLLNSDLDLYANHGSGHLLSRVAGETIGISIGIQRFFSAWARDAITSLGLIAVMSIKAVSLLSFPFAYLQSPTTRFHESRSD
jgi:subfamily B ATP-binding cassette protein MsbA